MIKARAETNRVEDTITRMLKTSGFEHAEAFVLPTGITVSLSDSKSESFSVTRRVCTGSTNMGKICLVNDVSRNFCSGKISLDEAADKLEKINSMTFSPAAAKLLGTALTTSGFTLLFGGTLCDAAAAAICGILLFLSNIFFGKITDRQFIRDVFGSAVITVSALLISFLFGKLTGEALQSQYIIVGSMMPLVPGVAITNAIRDTFHGDYISSAARIIESLLIAAAVAIGVGAGMAVSYGLEIITVEIEFVLSIPQFNTANLMTASLAAFVSIVGFSAIMEVPRKYIAAASLTAAVGWAAYLSAYNCFTDTVWASFAGAVIVEIFSSIFAKTLKAPVTLFLVGGILPLVPGMYIYRSVYYMMNSGGNASDELIQTILIAGAIALAIFVTDTLTDMLFRFSDRCRLTRGNPPDHIGATNKK